MNQTSEIANRLQEVFVDGTWVANTNFKVQIESTPWQKAIVRKEGLNSIALLTFHINYYLEGLIGVLNGGPLDIKDKFSFDMPAIENELQWLELISRFNNNAAKFIQQVRVLDDAQLNLPFVAAKYGTYLRNIECVIEHSYYHLGQVVLLNKLLK